MNKSKREFFSEDQWPSDMKSYCDLHVPYKGSIRIDSDHIVRAIRGQIASGFKEKCEKCGSLADWININYTKIINDDSESIV